MLAQFSVTNSTYFKPFENNVYLHIFGKKMHICNAA